MQGNSKWQYLQTFSFTQAWLCFLSLKGLCMKNCVTKSANLPNWGPFLHINWQITVTLSSKNGIDKKYISAIWHRTNMDVKPGTVMRVCVPLDKWQSRYVSLSLVLTRFRSRVVGRDQISFGFPTNGNREVLKGWFLLFLIKPSKFPHHITGKPISTVTDLDRGLQQQSNIPKNKERLAWRNFHSLTEKKTFRRAFAPFAGNAKLLHSYIMSIRSFVREALWRNQFYESRCLLCRWNTHERNFGWPWTCVVSWEGFLVGRHD